MRQKRKYKYKRPRYPKIRGKKNKHRAELKISDITAVGFRMRTFNREYHIFRNEFPWFKDASNKEIQDVQLCVCEYADPTECPDEGDYLRWESLDLYMGTNFFEYPDRFPFRAPSVRGVVRLDLFDKERKELEEWEERKKQGNPIPPFLEKLQ